MVKYCDLVICDSVNIEKYIHGCYDEKGIEKKNPNHKRMVWTMQDMLSIIRRRW